MLASVRTRLPRPWWWDGGIALGYAAVALVGVVWPEFQLAAPRLPVPAPVRVVVLVLVCAPALVRTRYPLAALVAAVPLVVVDGLLGLSMASALVLADLLYCAVLHGSPRTSEAVRRTAIGACCLLFVVTLLVVGDGRVVLQSVLSAVALIMLPVLWAGEVRRPVEEAAAERAAATQAARIAELDRRAAVADERAGIARDLHDSVAGHLSAISLQSQAALRADDETRDRVLHAVREDSVRALREMRALIEVLRAPGGAGGTSTRPADDHDAVRTGLVMILGGAEGVEVVAEARDGDTAVRRARDLRPDVVLMDVRMPGTDGIAATSTLTRERVSAVLVLTTFDLDEYVFAALRAGAAGFLLKSIDADRLVDAVRAVASGEGVLAPGVTSRVIAAAVAPGRGPGDADGREAEPPPGLADLTDREREVLDLLGEGLSNQQIGGRLCLSEATVKTHVSRVLAKLDLRSRTQAAIVARERPPRP